VITGNPGPAAIYRSSNGAQSWRRLNPRVSMTDVGDPTCPTVSTCYLLSSLLGNNGPRLAVLLTTDGGKSWSAKSGIDGVARAGLTPPQTQTALKRLSCPTAQTCFAAVTSLTFGATPAGPYTERMSVLSTTDGGATWTRHSPLPAWTTKIANPDAIDPLLTCPTVSTCYLVPFNFADPSKLRGIVLVTHDAGASWQRRVVKAHNALTDLTCAGAQSCRAIGAAGIFGTSDGGATWQKEAIQGGTPFPLPGGPLAGGIACPEVDTCYAVSGIAIVATHP
jgi:photosystem II stability/assembly factor-like uncharacterized protein